MANQRSGSTTSQLKHDIDSGLTGDKVAAPDPAASPLGTDDEAAGRPASPGTVTLARAQERATAKPGVERTPGSQDGGMKPLIWVGLVIAIFAAVIVAAFVALH